MNKNIKQLVPDDFESPLVFETKEFHFERLAPEFTKIDFEAVKEATCHIRELYDIADPEEWPNDKLTLEEDRADLVRHAKDFDEKKAFAYTVLSLDKKKCLGCIYIDPCEQEEYDTEVTLWGLNNELSEKIYKATRQFLKESFPFQNPAFPVFEIPMKEYGEK